MKVHAYLGATCTRVNIVFIRLAHAATDTQLLCKQIRFNFPHLPPKEAAHTPCANVRACVFPCERRAAFLT